tara:strand:- start:43 stop:3399 length:3357 start_codon:yes stop_codon:yes gene_type:complete
MSIVKVENPYTKEIMQVEFKGDTPTEEELSSLNGYFTSLQNPERDEETEEVSTTSLSQLDLATASAEEIREYGNNLRAVGINPTTGEQMSDEEFISNYKEPNVDYTTGVKSNDLFSRAQLGRMDNAEEKLNYIQTKVGVDGVREDGLGRLVLTQIGRQRVGLGEGKDIAIDETGLSWGDVKEFGGAVALPALAATGTAIAASGVGFIPGMLLVGLAGGAGKALDEGIEYAQGLQKQSFTEVAKDSAKEAALAATFEGGGRAISSVIGTIFKGKAGSKGIFKTNPERARIEKLRADAREMLGKGLRPTVGGATEDSFRPILNRLQAVYEGVFPNAGAATDNLNILLKEMDSLGVGSTSQIKNLDEVVKYDIKELYKSADETLADATRNFNKNTETDLNKIMSNLIDEKIAPKDLDAMIRQSKKVFDQDLDTIYSKLNKIFGKRQIIPVSGVLQALKKIDKESLGSISESTAGKKILQLGAERTTKARLPYASVKEMSLIRTGLNDAIKNMEIVGNVSQGSLSQLKKAVNNSFLDAEQELATAAAQGQNLRRITPANAEKNAAALVNLSKTNDFYRRGLKRFDNFTSENVVRQTRKGVINTDWVFKNIVLENDVEGLNQFLLALRGVPKGIKKPGEANFVRDISVAKRTLNNIPYGTNTLGRALKNARETMAPNSPVRLKVEKFARDAEQKTMELAKISGKGAEVADKVRQGLAKRWLLKQIDESRTVDLATATDIIDPVTLVAKIQSGKTKAITKLFGKELEDVNDVLTVLKRRKANISPSELIKLEQLPLGPALKTFKKAESARAALDSNDILKAISNTNDPDVIAGTVFRSPASIKQAEDLFQGRTATVNGNQVPVMDLVKDAAMGRILKQIGATTDDAGAVKLTEDFVNSFKSGRLGSKLESVLENYGDATLKKMFGPESAEGLKNLSQMMIKASNASIAGKGGLAAPQIALGFTLGNLLFSGNFLALATTGAGFKFMSAALRNPKVLKAMMRSRDKNTLKQLMSGKFKSGDIYGQGLQAANAIMLATLGQSVRGVVEQTTEEVEPYAQSAVNQAKPVVQQAISQLSAPIQSGASNLMPSVTPPNSASSVSNINPIVLPNPNDQVLAERAYARGNR